MRLRPCAPLAHVSGATSGASPVALPLPTTRWPVPDPLLGVTQKKLGSHARHRHLAVAMYLRPGVNP
ncbi:hypothetical protein XcvCFBP7113P_15390 [Xanthomonas citri pv. vignicola]|nr:hypothetical protein XcvCFBP7113P_15390 [Xanthomonas citri pv. vignicola]